jgi:hypothetical protein
MSFVDIFTNLDRDNLLTSLYGTNSADVERVLQQTSNKISGDVDSLLTLLSPAAEPLAYLFRCTYQICVQTNAITAVLR